MFAGLVKDNIINFKTLLAYAIAIKNIFESSKLECWQSFFYTKNAMTNGFSAVIIVLCNTQYKTHLISIKITPQKSAKKQRVEIQFLLPHKFWIFAFG